MKISDHTNTSTFFVSSQSSLPRKRKSMKPHKLNRQLHNQMGNLWKNSLPTMIPIDNCQIIPISSFSTNTQFMPLNMTVQSNNTNSTPIGNISPPTIASPPINQLQQNPPIYPLSKPFTTPRVTTTLIPLNICPTEYCQTIKSIPLVNIIENRQEQHISTDKSKDNVTTHLIGDWIIRESCESFRRKENEQLTSTNQPFNQEKTNISNESIVSHSSLSENVKEWTIDDVCSFFERVLNKNCYTPIIKDHLIDGTALLLLEDEHLNSIFKMQLGPRLKLLNRIDKLKNGHFSGL